MATRGLPVSHALVRTLAYSLSAFERGGILALSLFEQMPVAALQECVQLRKRRFLGPRHLA
jgi:hypothetical protein